MVSVEVGRLDIEFLLVLGQVSVVLPAGHCEAGQEGPDVTNGSGEERYGDEASPRDGSGVTWSWCGVVEGVRCFFGMVGVRSGRARQRGLWCWDQ